MKTRGYVLLALVCLAASQTMAASKAAKEKPAAQAASTASTATAAGDCKSNFKQEGNYLSGRSFSTWGIVPNVSVSTAFKRIYTEGTKSGLRVVSSDEKNGAISFDQPNGGVDLGGVKATLPWNVVLEPQGKNLKITVTKTTPGGFSTSKEYQVTSMCAVIDAGRNP